jgi:LCP family protein required for cell wall assembly
MTRNQKLILGILTVTACSTWLLIFLTTSKTVNTWREQPLGPTLSYPTELQLPATWTASPAAGATSTTTTPLASLAPSDTLTPIPPFLVCNYNLPAMTVLAIGTDVRPGEHRYGLTDVMRAVRVDFQSQRVTTLEFPRDLWVYIPGIEQNLKTDHQKLNTVYAYGSPDYGPSLLARTLKQNFGLKVNHYIVANMNVFAEIVDALGGLDVTIPPGGIDGRTRTDRSERLVFPEGLQHLDGTQALTLARIRNQNVFARAEHQNLVLCALRKKIESPETVLRLPDIIDSFRNNIQTDLTPEQISQLACLGTRMPRSNILFAAFPRELFQADETYDPVLKQDVFIWNADFNLLRSYVSEFQAGTWPSTPLAGSVQTEAGGCE